MSKKKNNQREFKNGLSFFIRYIKQYNVSLQFKVTLLDMLTNCIRTNNIHVFRDIINLLHNVSDKQRTENEILNSIKYITL